MNLVCIVEGHGERAALPNLCARILRQYLNDSAWFVDNDPIRCKRGELVDESKKGPHRPCRAANLEKRIIQAQRSRRADAVLVLCDSDDDCPAAWGPDAARVVNTLSRGGAVMALREYETWLLFNYTDEQLVNAGVPVPERKREAKEALSKLIPGYLPTTAQLTETRKLDISRVRKHSDSFDKLVRVLAGISGTTPPSR